MKYLSKKNLYIISELNENSMILAESIRKNDRSAEIIFASAMYDEKPDLHSKAKKLSCKIADKSIRSFMPSFRSQNSLTRVILNNNDENVNVNNALFLAEKYRDRINAEIYVFASSKESECLLDAVDKGNGLGKAAPLKIRRVNNVRNCIYNDLLHHSIFENAVTVFNEKVISVLIIGMGRYGGEMLKALLWCGQMTGYVLKINAVDISANAEEMFYQDCPGIRQRGTQPKNGEDYYEINIHSGLDAFSESFLGMVRTMPETTQVFAALGNEQKNIELALKLRSVFSGMQIDAGKKPMHSKDSKQTPRITAVIHNPQKSKLLNNNELCNFKNQYYDINCIGADDELYSFENIFASGLEALAMRAHSQWGDAESFNNFEYYRRSSMASAIHRKYRDELLPDDTDLKAMNEHMRWNAYMRSTEGYSFGYVRDDLALRHSTLVKYSMLSSIEKEKDARMNAYKTDK